MIIYIYIDYVVSCLIEKNAWGRGFVFRSQTPSDCLFIYVVLSFLCLLYSVNMYIYIYVYYDSCLIHVLPLFLSLFVLLLLIY